MYYIRLSKTQTQIIADALDLYSRVLSGDVGEVIDVYKETNSYPEYDHDYVNHHMDLVCRELVKLPLNASLGIFNPDTPLKAKIAYEIQKAIENKFYYERPEPRTYSVHSRIVNDITDEPIVKIQKTFYVLKKLIKKRKKKNGK